MRYLFSLILLVGAVMVFLLFAQPQLDQIRNLQGSQTAIEASLNELYELRRIRDGLLTQYNTIHPSDLARLATIVPSSADSGLLIAEMERFSRDNDLILTNVLITESSSSKTGSRSRTAQSQEGEVKPFPMTLQVSGTYQAFRGFLDRLERHVRIIDAEQISFQGGEDDLYNFTVTAKSYSREIPK